MTAAKKATTKRKPAKRKATKRTASTWKVKGQGDTVKAAREVEKSTTRRKVSREEDDLAKVVRPLVYLAAQEGAGRVELLDRIKKAVPKQDPMKVLVKYAAPQHGGFTFYSWPTWCGGDPNPVGICGCERFCVFHGGHKVAHMTDEQGRTRSNRGKCRACRRGDHDKHRSTYRRKGVANNCRCDECKDKTPKAVLLDMREQAIRDKQKEKAMTTKAKATTKSNNAAKAATKEVKKMTNAMSTTEAAAKLGIDAKSLRRYLRSAGRNVGQGGTYELTPAAVAKIGKDMKGTPVAKKATKAPASKPKAKKAPRKR